MKKFLIVLIVFVIICAGNMNKTTFTLTDYFDGEYYCYVKEKKDNCINLGSFFMTDKKISSCLGESMEVNVTPDNIIDTLKVRVVKNEYLENGTTIIYGFSNLINKNVKVDNKRVNVQIAITESKTVVGWPVIMGSY
ncbi:MAG: hypothetical protein E7374_00615 [Clostridiales bacterium]|nr:hypothetical protein [Clostridiales bacterium]